MGVLYAIKDDMERIQENSDCVYIDNYWLGGDESDVYHYVLGKGEGITSELGYIIHGGIPAKKRTEIVEKFNDENTYVPYIVLSLKAAGTGLNLTAANHVIHFDRWWNPAVENQASDRAYRIGQTKEVFVHKLVSNGTIEEKIDKLIESKQELANSILASGQEKWITELDTNELMDLLRLDV